LQNVLSLAELVGVSEFEVYRYAYRAQLHYRQIAVPKQCGGTRTISTPEEGLKCIQRNIAKKILAHQEVHEAATSHRVRRPTLSNACVHADHDFVFNLSIKDLFATIRAKRVRSLFSGLGAEQRVAGFLTRLVTYHGVLPPGAPTSRVIANLVCRMLDERLATYCAAHSWTYTRNCDDIKISGDGSFSAQDDVCAIVESEGFTVNETKVRLATKRAPQSVTGLAVNRMAIMTREQRRKLRLMFHHAAVDPARYAALKHKMQSCLGLLETINADDPALPRYRKILSTL